MVVDRRLDNVLRILLQPGQADPNRPEGSRVYASAATVLATLTNPLNVSLLSTQILVSPAIWQSPDGLRAALRTFGVFQSATLGKIESPGGILGIEDWLNALVRGANQNGKDGGSFYCWTRATDSVQYRVGNIYYCSAQSFRRTRSGRIYLASHGTASRTRFVGQ